MNDREALKSLIENKKDRQFYLDCLDDGVSIEKITELNDKYKSYKNLFVQKNQRPSDFRKMGNTLAVSFDVMEFIFDREIEKSQAKKKIRSFFSKKNIHLVDEKTEMCFVDLIRINADAEFYRGFRKKVAAFNDTASLNSALTKEIQTIKNWNYSFQKSQVSSSEVDILKEDENELVFEVFDHDTARSLGTNMWCICRENEDFMKYRDKTDRIIFKLDLNVPVSRNHSMTAYVVTASGELINGYLKNDDVMSKEEEILFKPEIDALNPENYMRRLENSSLSHNEYALKAYQDNMQKEMKNVVSNINVNVEDLDSYLAANSSSKLMNNLLDNYKDFLSPEKRSDGLSIMMHRLNRLQADNVLYQRFLENEDYVNSDYFLSSRLMDVIERDCLFINSESVKMLVEKRGYDLNKEIGDFLDMNSSMSDDRILSPVYKEAGVNITKYLKESGKEGRLRDILYRNFNLADDLFGGNENPNDIMDVFRGHEDKYESYFLEKLKTYADSKGLEPISSEVSEQMLKNEILRHPKKIFIKQSKLESRKISFDYDESLVLLKKAFLDDNMPFNHYEKDYAMEDFLDSGMNEKSRIFLLESNLIDSKARSDLFDFLDTCKNEVSEKLQLAYEEKRPKTKNIKPNKLKLR